MKRGLKWLLVNYPWNALQTTIHKFWVLYYIVKLCRKTKWRWSLIKRGIVHDFSKYSNAEALFFSDVIFDLKRLQYGTPMYQAALDKIRPCLDHHYKNNSHHPEFYADGYRGMSHLDKLEMICDWCAACRRHVGGDIFKSLELNQKRFGYSDADKAWLKYLATHLVD